MAIGVPAREPDEHARFARYRRAFGEVGDEDAAALVAEVLTDPETAMANGAVCEYLDRRAAELLTGPGFPAWWRRMSEAAATDAFSVRRLREWALIRAIAVAEPWEAEALLGGSNWLQLRVAQESPVPAALAVLAEGGRSRRVRNIADSRLRTVR
ncbi:hypothetical protein ACPC54_06560 [Kitasatospora sp. NPDC094028]